MAFIVDFANFDKPRKLLKHVLWV